VADLSHFFHKKSSGFVEIFFFFQVGKMRKFNPKKSLDPNPANPN
jgi:hypothetical protein